MNTIKLLLGLPALLALSLSSCTTDDDPSVAEISKSEKQIRFAAATELTRAEVTSNNLTTFNVYAYIRVTLQVQKFLWIMSL